MGIQTPTIRLMTIPYDDAKFGLSRISPGICTGNDHPLLYGNNGSLDPKQLLLTVVYPIVDGRLSHM